MCRSSAGREVETFCKGQFYYSSGVRHRGLSRFLAPPASSVTTFFLASASEMAQNEREKGQWQRLWPEHVQNQAPWDSQSQSGWRSRVTIDLENLVLHIPYLLSASVFSSMERRQQKHPSPLRSLRRLNEVTRERLDTVPGQRSHQSSSNSSCCY